MKIIETNFDGHRFRSRTEARWAVFFKAAGIAYEYEKEGVVLDGDPYLPDFWLPDMKLWMEVKGDKPTAKEHSLCGRLATTSGYGVMLAVGTPKPEEQIFWFDPNPPPDDPFGGEQCYFADDRRNDNEFWLVAEGSICFPIGPAKGPGHDRYPLVHTATKAGYDAAKSARFEHGGSG